MRRWKERKGDGPSTGLELGVKGVQAGRPRFPFISSRGLRPAPCPPFSKPAPPSSPLLLPW